MHTAITENRKSNNPVVLSFQGRSQLETRYGHAAEAMLSQPATKIFLRTSEPHAAKWIADTLGDIETERLRESRSSARGGQQSYGLERQVEPLVIENGSSVRSTCWTSSLPFALWMEKREEGAATHRKPSQNGTCWVWPPIRK